MASARNAAPELPVIPFQSAREWEVWLEEHHAESSGLWMKIAKISSGHSSVTYAEALDVALCYGWIDGQKKSHDDAFWLQKFTPRRSKSIWSKINREKVEALIRDGRMKPAGHAAIESAKKDGRWDAAYGSQGKADIPEDFQARLDASPAAAEFFATLNSTNRFAMLFRVQTAKKPETRARRIDQFIAMLERGEKLYP